MEHHDAVDGYRAGANALAAPLVKFDDDGTARLAPAKGQAHAHRGAP